MPASEIGRVLDTPDYATMIKRSSTLSVEYYDFANCQSGPGWRQSTCPPNEAVTAGLVGGSPMQNVHFRQALTQAIDKTDLIKDAFAGIGVAAYSPTMPGIQGFPTYTASNTPLPYDPRAALVNLAPRWTSWAWRSRTRPRSRRQRRLRSTLPAHHGLGQGARSAALRLQLRRRPR